MSDGSFGSGDEKTLIDQVREFDAREMSASVELVMVHVKLEGTSAPWRAIEIETANTVYRLAADRTCLEVVSKTQGPAAGQTMVGAALVGGQVLHSDQRYSLSYPYPAPGMRAVFRVGPSKYVTTSEVERVKIRVRMLEMERSEDSGPDWSRITSKMG